MINRRYPSDSWMLLKVRLQELKQELKTLNLSSEEELRENLRLDAMACSGLDATRESLSLSVDVERRKVA